MIKWKFFRQILDILTKIFSAFVIVFLFYFVGKIFEDFAYNYFIFPLVAVLTIFICGVNVGRSLEKLKTNDAIGFFTRNKKIGTVENLSTSEKTEFIIKDTSRIVTNKKILKEVQDGDKIHLKVFNYNDFENNERE